MNPDDSFVKWLQMYFHLHKSILNKTEDCIKMG